MMAGPPKDAVKDALRKMTPQKGTLKRVLRADSFRRLGGGTTLKPPHEKYSEQAYKGKVFRVPDVAFITYVYTTRPRDVPKAFLGSRHFYFISTRTKSNSHR